MRVTEGLCGIAIAFITVIAACGERQCSVAKCVVCVDCSESETPAQWTEILRKVRQVVGELDQELSWDLTVYPIDGDTGAGGTALWRGTLWNNAYPETSDSTRVYRAIRAETAEVIVRACDAYEKLQSSAGKKSCILNAMRFGGPRREGVHGVSCNRFVLISDMLEDCESIDMHSDTPIEDLAEAMRQRASTLSIATDYRVTVHHVRQPKSLVEKGRVLSDSEIEKVWQNVFIELGFEDVEFVR